MNELLKRFLASGCLGKIALGLSSKQVEAIIRPPEDKISKASRRRVVWELDGWTLSFFKGKLDIIALYWKNGGPSLPIEILPNKEGSFEFLKHQDFVNFLLENQIKYEVDKSQSTECLTCLRMKSGVKVYFESQELYSIEIIDPGGG